MNYETAEKLLRHNRTKLVVGAKVRPQWIDGGARFWYSTEDDRTYVVDPAAGTREPYEPEAQVSDPLEIRSPDGKSVVFLRDFNLWTRSGGEERQLTFDGDADAEYAANLDYMMRSRLAHKLGLAHLPPAVSWSPDSTRVLTHRTNQRGVRETHLIDALPDGGGASELVTVRTPFPGDETLPVAELVVIEVATGRVKRADAEPLAMPVISPVTQRWAWWSADAAYYLSRTRDMHELSLHRLDPSTGAVTRILAETGKTRVDPAQGMTQRPMVYVFSHGKELLWYSQRDGWGHLYLYEKGEVRHQVTSGEWAVQEILRVDEDARAVYFLASGLVADDPYRRSVCRIGLDGTGFRRIVDDDFDHVVTVSKNERYFVDSASTVDTPPVIVVRDWDGNVLVEVERADISKLLATGWTPPVPFVVKADDGVTDIFGKLHLPHDFDPATSYPVVDHPYPSPHHRRCSASFDPGFEYLDADAIAALGFVVMAVDGRGTGGRDKAFQDASYGRISDLHLVDHVAALRQLAATRPWMDLDRVGAFGLSGGGHATVRAMLDFPDVFKVGVAEAGNHDNRFYLAGWAETYDGPVGEADYGRASNVDIADRLEGKLLLVHGGMDDNVSPQLTLRLVERLIQLDKDFEMLIVPGAEHLFFGYEHYINRRKWDFLVRHLHGVEPPAYRLTPVPVDFDAIAALFD
ncbi:S9 family peptidase [Fodinicola acaciae]|uniref:S9 family peptidase n=1 Tax=Fodinicola acaciae TaxID=2681555 RepID=UPI0013D52392|nr:DPP IV N-terminal domain-containing protein [Fodinicola acaciae]